LNVPEGRSQRESGRAAARDRAVVPLASAGATDLGLLCIEKFFTMRRKSD
jgi:hypothetical protein